MRSCRRQTPRDFVQRHALVWRSPEAPDKLLHRCAPSAVKARGPYWLDMVPVAASTVTSTVRLKTSCTSSGLMAVLTMPWSVPDHQ